MNRYLLDTDDLSLHERGHAPLRKRMGALPPISLCASVISVEETMRGRLAVLARRVDESARVHAYAKLMEAVSFFASITVVPFDSKCADRFEELRCQRIRIGSQDLRIAATALVNGLIVVTRNHNDFARVPGLQIEDWSEL